MIKSSRITGAEHVARMGRRRRRIGYWWESQKVRDHWEDQDIEYVNNAFAACYRDSFIIIKDMTTAF
jgi:hypothetical protein